MHRYIALLLGCWSLLVVAAQAADPQSTVGKAVSKPLTAAEKGALPKEADFYRIVKLPIPDKVNLESSGLELMPDGKLAVASRRGDIYLVENPFSEKTDEIKFKQFATGLHEILGLAQKDGAIYATQRGEVTRIKDSDKDGKADLFETVADGWGITGDYHEYAFQSKFDKNGDLWVVLCLTGSFTSQTKYRGWCLRVTPKGEVIPTCSGLRSPGGIGMNAKGDMFYTDNQGPWNGACSLKHLKPGSFQGHPDGNRWYASTDAIGPRPKDPESGSRIVTEAKKIPEYMPPPVIFPFGKMGQSAAGIACDTTGGKFGPFQNQMFVSDQSHSTVMRVFMEEIGGRYQGACFPFREGFGSGSLSLLMTEKGALFVGGTNRGWGSRGGSPFALERLEWTGKVPFEVLEMKAKPDGFELVFTQPVDPATAGDVASYAMTTYCYIFQSTYGSPEVDHTSPTIEKAEVAADNKSVRLRIKGLMEGHIHDLEIPGVRNADGQPLLHNKAYYTLNQLAK